MDKIKIKVKLKPCPFCGYAKPSMAKGKVWWVSEKYQGNIKVAGCPACGCVGGIFNTLAMSEEEAKRKAIRSWNRRAK